VFFFDVWMTPIQREKDRENERKDKLSILGAFACPWPKLSWKISVANMRTLGRSEETLLSSGWTLIGSELSSPNFNTSVRAERSFAIRYLNVVIKPLCGNPDIGLNYYFQSRNSVRMLSVTDHDRKLKMLFWIALFGCALAQFSRSKSIPVTKNPSTRMHLLYFYFYNARS